MYVNMAQPQQRRKPHLVLLRLALVLGWLCLSSVKAADLTLSLDPARFDHLQIASPPSIQP
jgi:hypothetical protein